MMTTLAPASVRVLRVGSAARIRPSSVMMPSLSGTLKSERTRTRLPRRSPRVEMVLTRSPFGLKAVVMYEMPVHERARASR